MVSKLEIGDKFFLWLTEIDEETSRQVAAGGCPACGGPLHRGDYPRKPRGGLLGIAGEAFSKRISLCCGRAGCRKRATPPSVRFLGRRVYLGAAVMLASAMACLVAVAQVGADWQIPARTVHRWTQAWQQEFPKGRFYQEQQGRFIPPLAAKRLPASLMERLEGPGRDEQEVLVRTLCFLSPLTTGSVCGGASYSRAEKKPAEDGNSLGGS